MMNSADKKTKNWKQKIRHEFIEYWINVIYLTFVFASFTVHQRLVLAAHDIIYTNYGFAVIQALVLGKVIMVGGVLNLGRGFEDRPLVYPTLYKTVVFTIFVGVFKVVEQTIVGLVAGEGIMSGLTEIGEKGIDLILANSLLVFVALIPFFAVKELGRLFGREKIFALFFRPRDPQ